MLLAVLEEARQFYCKNFWGEVGGVNGWQIVRQAVNSTNSFEAAAEFSLMHLSCRIQSYVPIVVEVLCLLGPILWL